ncbi:hypothetical protein L596_007405 [Steinernema carpocapsae]|uniref:CCR4-NOT transcription complex subunit 10 n=1 Tax=Steinernema carpocapsae TaxID=34508 RepID=A0A4V6A632_STECR|nr:hypothetical protein L596_007405 [Steinernema carpocapsae]
MANAKMFGEDYFRVAKAESGIDFFNCDTKLFPDPIAATVGFNLAIGEFHRGKKLSALNAIRAILHSPNIPNSLMCEASLLEINILLDLRQNIALLNAVKTLQAKPCWVAASPKQKETAEKLVIRARIAASTDKFALTQVQQERSTLGWLICRAEVDARNDDVASCVSRLLTARAAATSDDRALIDNTLGCLYAAVLKKANFSEAFFRSAMKATKPSEDAFGEYGSVPRSVLVYNLALSLMAQSQFREAFRLLVLTMPYYQHLPRYWLRLAECCICELEENEEPDESDDSLIHSAVKGVVLQTRFRKAITAVYPDPARHAYHLEENSKEFFNDLRNGAIPKLTYENALACLRNAQTLSGDDRTFVYLLSSTHALTAFVNLKLRRPCIALRAATQLLNLPQSARNPQIYVRGVLLKAMCQEASSKLTINPSDGSVGFTGKRTGSIEDAGSDRGRRSEPSISDSGPYHGRLQPSAYLWHDWRYRSCPRGVRTGKESHVLRGRNV